MFEKERASFPFKMGEFGAFNANGLICRSMSRNDVILAMTEVRSLS